MSTSALQPTIDAFVEALCARHLGARLERDPGIAREVSRFVSDQLMATPDYLRFPILLATWGFGVWGIVTGGRPFHALNREQQWRQIDGWRRSPLGPCRDLVRLFESLSVFESFVQLHPTGPAPVAR